MFVSCKRDFTTYKAEAGVLDLRNWNSDLEPVISLDGNWEFYWNELYSDSSQVTIKQDYINLPSSWNNRIINDQKLNGSGFATFKLKILLPEKKTFTHIRDSR